MEQFKTGDVVEWRSQAGGSFKTKRGIVVQVVPSRRYPEPLPDNYGGGMWRDHESYIVSVQKTPKSKFRTYWPVAAKLRRVEG